ncbi:MAG: Ezrin/radixin/moesin family protein [Cytophagia bacterium]|nr:Ezrin/radixin/moesin family protein [Cytophagia bacterium]
MKPQKALLTLILGIMVASVALAQTSDTRPLTKKEKKEWKKKKRKMSAEDFRNMYEENSGQKAQIASMESEISNLESQISSKDEKISDLQKQVTRMQAAYQAAQNEIEKLKAEQANRPVYNPNLINGEDFSVGVVFKVQVGAFRKMDLEKYANSSKEFSEEGADDLRKYVIGNFRNYEDANVLKRYLREMGVEDAWIVPYKDGQRVPLKDVLPGAPGEN